MSIIIPVYNVAGYLDRCLASVLQQTLQEIEVICINDASTDNSLDILEKYAATDKRMRVITVQKSGQGIIRNMGIDLASGVYVGFVDADDYVDHTMFEKLYEAATRNDSDIAFCYARCLDPDGKVVKSPYFDREWKKCGFTPKETIYKPEDIYPFLSHITVVAWNKIYRKAALKEKNVGFGPGIIHEDIPFYYQAMLNANRITLIREFLYKYSVNRLGSTTNAVMSTHPRVLYALRETREKITPWLNDNEVAKQFNEFEVNQLLSFLIYAFHRHDVKVFTRLRFFSLVHEEFTPISFRHLRSMSLADRAQVWAIKKKSLKLYLVKKNWDIIRYHMKDFKRFKNYMIYLGKMSYYHTKHYTGKLKHKLKESFRSFSKFR